MAKVQPTTNDFQVSASRNILYYFLKREIVSRLPANFFTDMNYLGVAFFPDKGAGTNRRSIDIHMRIFSTGIARKDIIKQPSILIANAEVPFLPKDVEKFDFAFLDKVQLEWLMKMMDSEDRLCLADCYIDMGTTPPYSKSANSNQTYLTFKLWIQKDQNRWILATGNNSTNSFPSFTIIPPCPPVWPELSSYTNSFFRP